MKIYPNASKSSFLEGATLNINLKYIKYKIEIWNKYLYKNKKLSKIFNFI